MRNRSVFFPDIRRIHPNGASSVKVPTLPYWALNHYMTYLRERQISLPASMVGRQMVFDIEKEVQKNFDQRTQNLMSMSSIAAMLTTTMNINVDEETKKVKITIPDASKASLFPEGSDIAESDQNALISLIEQRLTRFTSDSLGNNYIKTALQAFADGGASDSLNEAPGFPAILEAVSRIQSLYGLVANEFPVSKIQALITSDFQGQSVISYVRSIVRPLRMNSGASVQARMSSAVDEILKASKSPEFLHIDTVFPAAVYEASSSPFFQILNEMDFRDVFFAFILCFRISQGHPLEISKLGDISLRDILDREFFGFNDPSVDMPLEMKPSETNKGMVLIEKLMHLALIERSLNDDVGTFYTTSRSMIEALKDPDDKLFGSENRQYLSYASIVLHSFYDVTQWLLSIINDDSIYLPLPGKTEKQKKKMVTAVLKHLDSFKSFRVSSANARFYCEAAHALTAPAGSINEGLNSLGSGVEYIIPLSAESSKTQILLNPITWESLRIYRNTGLTSDSSLFLTSHRDIRMMSLATGFEPIYFTSFTNNYESWIDPIIKDVTRLLIPIDVFARKLEERNLPLDAIPGVMVSYDTMNQFYLENGIPQGLAEVVYEQFNLDKKRPQRFISLDTKGTVTVLLNPMQFKLVDVYDKDNTLISSPEHVFLWPAIVKETITSAVMNHARGFFSDEIFASLDKNDNPKDPANHPAGNPPAGSDPNDPGADPNPEA